MQRWDGAPSVVDECDGIVDRDQMSNFDQKKITREKLDADWLVFWCHSARNSNFRWSSMACRTTTFEKDIPLLFWSWSIGHLILQCGKVSKIAERDNLANRVRLHVYPFGAKLLRAGWPITLCCSILWPTLELYSSRTSAFLSLNVYSGLYGIH
jgi:hypothetical protein